MKDRKRLPQHGSYAAGKSQQVVTFSARGPWNEETMRQGSKALGAVIRQLDLTKPWAQISCMYGESLMPPAAFEMFVQQSAIRKSAGLEALAIVMKDCETPHTTRAQLAEGYSRTRINHQFFDSVKDAIVWTQNLSFTFDENEVYSFFKNNPL